MTVKFGYLIVACHSDGIYHGQIVMAGRVNGTNKLMNRNKTDKTLLTFSDAADKAHAFVNILTHAKLIYTFNHVPSKNYFMIIGVKDADSIKVLLPQAEIKTDVHRRRYAELVINYE